MSTDSRRGGQAQRPQAAARAQLARWAARCGIAAAFWWLVIQPSHAAGSVSGTFYGPGGGVAVGKFQIQPTPKCPKDEPPHWENNDPRQGPTDAWLAWDGCQDVLDAMFARIEPPAKLSAHATRPASRAGMSRAAAASAAPALTSSSSTPYLPFLGNPLTVLSYVPDNTNVANATTAYAVALRRQSDCSLVQDFLASDKTAPSAWLAASLPAVQNYFHQLAGLTTTPNVFAQGCGTATLGQPSTANVQLLGTKSNGAVISAELASAGIYISLTDVTASQFTSTLTIPSTTIGAYAVADLNGDGNLDIVATFVTDPVTQQPSTAVFLGNGDGTFKPGAYYDVAGLKDVTGNGIPDIVVCGSTPGITTLLGKGDGTFTIGPTSATGVKPCFQSAGQVLSGDFNGDGRKDLLAAGVVLLGNGDGTFTLGSPLTADPGFNFSSSIPAVAVGDLNKDGKLDVVVSQPGVVALFYGNGDGTFRAGPRYAGLPDYMQVSITDVDGDGNPDIVLGTAAAGVTTDGCCAGALAPRLFQVLMGRGDGTFVDSLVYPQGGAQIASGDFNGDGKADLLVVNKNPSALVVMPGDGSGKLGAPVTSPLDNGARLLAVADMNKDGRPDVVVAGFNGAPLLSVLINQGSGSFGAERDYALPNIPVSLVVGDFNGDGLMDVAVGVAPQPGGSGP
jgi:hypothetical protein